MNKEEIEYCGLKIVVNNETYAEYKGTLEEQIEILQQENQELKEKINGVDEERTYLYNKLSAENEQLNSLVNSCQEEIRRLKKQLEEKNKPQIFIDTQDMEERYSEGLYQDYLEEENKKYKNQQKEFIKYLENEIKIYSNVYMEDMLKEIEEILSKYREIIGVSK